MIFGIELALGTTFAASVASVPMSLITPVAGLSTGDLAGALGAFVWAVAGFVCTKVFDRRQRPRNGSKKASLKRRSRSRLVVNLPPCVAVGER